MPIYEYLCQACGHELEVIQKLSDDLLKVCPECDKPKLKKKVSASAFRLSGSGWYETDFKTGDKKNLSGDRQAKSESGDKSSSSDGGSKESTKKDGDSKKAETKKTESKSSGSDNKSKPAASGAG
ncbi:MAG: zinc ribbon domain-containing protein [Porticoccaceae bacterium]|nr:zinc ribbon domain-containing protein [Porticoccaceae bacterium]